MRYIYYIIIIVFISSVMIGYKLFVSRLPEQEAALIINDRVISLEEFKKSLPSRVPYMKDKSDFINYLITRELLIQEAKKEGIDKEESFRKSIQNFYEQSLIKILMDRKFASLKIAVSDDEINRYIELLNKRFHLTLFPFDNMDEAKKGDYKEGEKRIVSFRDLSRDIRNRIVSLREGDVTEPIRIGKKYIVFRLDKVEILREQLPPGITKEMLRRMLIEEKKEEVINEWVASLRKKASIKILLNENR